MHCAALLKGSHKPSSCTLHHSVSMLRRSSTARRYNGTTALSPYAQALKHVALRGAAAFGPSAKEQELLMYRAGTLPADYRPPVQGRWDDTMERWAYAWQFPATEDAHDGSPRLGDIVKSHELPKLVAFCQKLIAHPPSKLPGSSRHASSLWPSVESTDGIEGSSLDSTHRVSADDDFYQALEDRIRNLDSLDAVAAAAANSTAAATEATPSPVEATLSAPQPVGEGDDSFRGEGTDEVPTAVVSGCTASDMSAGGPATNPASLVDAASRRAMMPAEQFSRVSGVPAAYIDDGSELAVCSKELCAIVTDSFSLTYEEPSLALGMRALAVKGHVAEVQALLRLAGDLGFGPTAEMYRSLMAYSTERGDVNGSMAVIETMKAAGVTPRIGNWHELMLCFHKAKDYPAVQQIAQHMKAYANLEPNEVTFAIQLRALAKDQSRQSSVFEAIQLFDHMEHVVGFVASRPQYHALMQCLCSSPQPEMRQRCEELGKKMELLGMTWDGTTFLLQIMSAQVVGDLKAIEKLFGKMRNEGVPMTIAHLTWAIHGHTEAMLRLEFKDMKERNEDPLPKVLEIMSTCFGIQELAVRRGWRLTVPFVNSLLRLCCQATMVVMEHMPDDTAAMGRMESQAVAIWEKTFTELGLQRDAFSYHNYIALLAHQQRLDEAEKLFQELVLTHDATPSRRTYEAMIFGHISSGEEGGTARALHYLEAMERAKLPIRASLIKKIVKLQNAAGYKRDMKRRARRIMQAREEYMARKAEGVDMSPKPYQPPERDADGNLIAVPLPISPTSTLAWWDRWRRESINKHELFSGSTTAEGLPMEQADGTPKGETFEEKNEALRQMGIVSTFLTKDDVPDASKHRLLPKLRAEEGEVTGGIWGLDGGELSYPSGAHGPQGWGVRLWRDRQVIKRVFDDAVSAVTPQAALLSSPDFSTAGIARRSVPDQLAIESSGATNAKELRDVAQFPDHVYDDGTPKPASEFAVEVPRSAELVWQQERKDRLAPFKTDDEISMEADSTFHRAMSNSMHSKVEATVTALQTRREFETDVVGGGPARRSKHDYLDKWREMYRHGTLEVPDEPLERYGVRSDDHKATLANTVREWQARNRRPVADESTVSKWAKEEVRAKERAASKEALIAGNRRRRLRKQ